MTRAERGQPAAAPVLAIDPGRDKCGVAVVRPDGVVLHRQVVSTGEIDSVVSHLVLAFQPEAFVIGDRTGHRDVVNRLIAALPERLRSAGIHRVDERDTSRAARDRWRQEHPPRGLARLIPPGMRVPPGPVDDLAAVILAERFFARRAAKR